ncbi:hypothetical protein TGME49_299270 [Toxoplasma gondii ME49]|uniref:Uncharacterized protein n=4 Tax=Toxoplasma gondii TaxID=5811 RepID=B6KVC2_TOXGV|nr:hypothetical protein TGME49_299270 [Toxoplasma gondii ME49]ESS30415.1 hypothetical protein TGVEG_299270 [Toxoplasma gondii VEG]KFG35364.1 hypothetical protein TGDOM2_299270 [Toxoplasma gondii GAB2-2007-GAL-DOM2]KYF42061.1 hypothetical protein TGARI_299270 [Toxoplasma gondii ARI]EPT31657.1 hypothetical protein TGME49_299270 [Toxoplasma gondii ME49]CEL72356.1 TPA: hypothetical protein BN1205_104970 [Toxoplasma gondii VEG]|eukprot:XP_002371795.1 hypothetical protein TGME49_299270 [Toxoplasma gondii ME49]
MQPGSKGSGGIHRDIVLAGGSSCRQARKVFVSCEVPSTGQQRNESASESAELPRSSLSREDSSLVTVCTETATSVSSATKGVSLVAYAPSETKAEGGSSFPDTARSGLSQVARDFPPSLPEGPDFSLSSLLLGGCPGHTSSGLSRSFPSSNRQESVAEASCDSTNEGFTYCEPSHGASSASCIMLDAVDAPQQSVAKSRGRGSTHCVLWSCECRPACRLSFSEDPPPHAAAAHQRGQPVGSDGFSGEDNGTASNGSCGECFRVCQGYPLSCEERAPPHFLPSTSMSGLRHLARLDELRREADAATLSQIERIASRLARVEHVTWLEERKRRQEGQTVNKVDSKVESGQKHRNLFDFSQVASTRSDGVPSTFPDAICSAGASSEDTAPLHPMRERGKHVREELPEKGCRRQKISEDWDPQSFSGNEVLTGFSGGMHCNDGREEEDIRSQTAPVSNPERTRKEERRSLETSGASDEDRGSRLRPCTSQCSEAHASAETCEGLRKFSQELVNAGVGESLDDFHTRKSTHKCVSDGVDGFVGSGPEPDAEARLAGAADFLLRRGIPAAVFETRTDATVLPLSSPSVEGVALADVMPQFRSETTLPLWVLWWYCGRHAAATARNGEPVGQESFLVSVELSSSSDEENCTSTKVRMESGTFSKGQTGAALSGKRSEPPTRGREEGNRRQKKGETRVSCDMKGGRVRREMSQEDDCAPVDFLDDSSSLSNTCADARGENEDRWENGTEDEQGTRPRYTNTSRGRQRGKERGSQLSCCGFRTATETRDGGEPRSGRRGGGSSPRSPRIGMLAKKDASPSNLAPPPCDTEAAAEAVRSNLDSTESDECTSETQAGATEAEYSSTFGPRSNGSRLATVCMEDCGSARRFDSGVTNVAARHAYAKGEGGAEFATLEQTSGEQKELSFLRCSRESHLSTWTPRRRVSAASNAEGTVSRFAIQSTVVASRDLLATDGGCLANTDTVDTGLSPRKCEEATHFLDHFSPRGRPVFIDLRTPRCSPRAHARLLRGSTPVSRVGTPIQRPVGAVDMLPPGEEEPKRRGTSSSCRFVSAASPSSEPSHVPARDRKRTHEGSTPCYPPLDLVTVSRTTPGSTPRKRQPSRGG